MADARWEIEVARPGDRAALSAEWRALEDEADASFFLSWSWIGTWLESLKTEPLLLRLRNGAQTAGLALLVPGQARRHGFVKSRQWHLNAAGDPDLDRIAIEYNGILLRRGLGDDVLAVVMDFLSNRYPVWDELVLPGVTQNYATAGIAAGLACVIDHGAPAYVIDLDHLRRNNLDLMQTLSANSRAQLRQALRMTQGSAALVLEPARDVEQAHRFFAGLQALDRRAGQGAFATPVRESFHRRLIATALPRGELEILEARSGDTIFGYLYHFVYRGRVLSYQIGYRPGPDNRHRPGLVMHYLAAERAMRSGIKAYDFLAGEARYKRSLARVGETLLWCRLQRPRTLFALERGARRIWTALRP